MVICFKTFIGWTASSINKCPLGHGLRRSLWSAPWLSPEQPSDIWAAPQGGGQRLELQVFLFLQASGTLHRVVSRAFDRHDPRWMILFPESQKVSSSWRVGSSVSLHWMNSRKQRLLFNCWQDLLLLLKMRGALMAATSDLNPPTVEAQCYFNRKLFHSIQM